MKPGLGAPVRLTLGLDTSAARDSNEAPWVIVKTEQKMRGRLEAMRFVLNQFDYTNKEPEMVASLVPLIISRVSRLVDKEGHSNIIED